MNVNRWVVAGLALMTLAAPRVRADDAPINGITLRLIDKGYSNPVFLTADPEGRSYVVDQHGRIFRLDKDMHKGKTPWLNIVQEVHMQNECGLLSVAFHPDFEKNGRFFVDYSKKDPQLRSVIAEFHVDPNADTVDPATEKEILTYIKPQENHNGGLVMFGPDKDLYIGTGDGGAGGDTGEGHVPNVGNAQTLSVILGKILRIDVDHPADGKPYGIPKDNPCYTGLKCAPEIYAYGLRNPWRFSFDRKTGELFCGDVGQGLYEEVDVIVKGGNYGWHIREGLHPFHDQPFTGKLIDPIAEYKHPYGICITGGYVYRGKAFPEMQGVYFYGDYAAGRVWGLKYENGKVTSQGELEVSTDKRKGPNQFSPSSFGEDADGELYVCDYGRGQIYQITPTK